MKKLAIAVVLAAALPAPALAHNRPVVPQGNSGADQYVEIIPTAGGGRPSHTVHGVGNHRSAGSGVLPAATRQAMSAQGAVGSQAAAFVQATAPSSSVAARAPHRSRRSPHGASITTGGGSAPPSSSAAAPAPRAATATVIDSLTGGTGSGGLGVALPIVLGLTLLGLVAIRLRRAWRRSA